MRKVLKMRAGVLFGLAVAAAVLVSSLQNAEARPNYLKDFTRQYPKVKEAKKVKCNVCHMGKSKKNRNNYGKAVAKTLGDTKVKDSEKVKEALKKAEEEKSAIDGKTFGDLLKDGKLPASSE